MVEKEHLSVIRPELGTKPRVFYKNLDEALTHLVADFAPERHAHLLRHARSQKSRGETPRLENDHLAVREESVLEEHLRDLRGLA